MALSSNASSGEALRALIGVPRLQCTPGGQHGAVLAWEMTTCSLLGGVLTPFIGLECTLVVSSLCPVLWDGACTQVSATGLCPRDPPAACGAAGGSPRTETSGQNSTTSDTRHPQHEGAARNPTNRGRCRAGRNAFDVFWALRASVAPHRCAPARSREGRAAPGAGREP